MKKRTLRELIELDTKEKMKNKKEVDNPKLKEKNQLKQKGFHSLEIDNDNGMCVYDYLYNGM